MKKNFIFLFLVLTSFLFSQNESIDSLTSVLKVSKQDTNKTKSLILLGREYASQNLIDTSNYYLKNALVLSESLNYKPGIARSLHLLGNNLLNTGNNYQAINHYTKALELYKGLHSKKSEANVYNNIGNAHNNLGNHSEAIKNHLFALKLREELRDTSGLIASYNNIAVVYSELEKRQESINLYQKALKLSILSGKKINAAEIYNNIGSNYHDLNNYQEALKYFSASLKIREEANDKWGIASARYGLGNAYLGLKKHTEAENNYLSAAEIWSSINALRELAFAQNALAGLNLVLNKPDQARIYLVKSIKLAEETQAKDVLAQAYKHSVWADSLKGDFKNYMKDFALYFAYHDSLINEENIKKTLQSQMEYDFGKKEIELKNAQILNESQIKESNSKQRFLIVSLSSGVIIALLIVLLFSRQKKFKSEQRGLQLEQKLLRSQMNPHFIFNSLIAIESYIYDNDPSTAGAYLSKFAQLMRQTLESSKEEYITLEKEIISLQNYLTLQQLRFENTFTFTIHIDGSINTTQIKIPPMLTQPFIENAIEHGFKKNQGVGELQINFQLKDECLIGEVIDNGIGIYQSQNKSEVDPSHSSMALGITKERLELLNKGSNKKINLNIKELNNNGKVTGTGVYFSIPLKR